MSKDPVDYACAIERRRSTDFQTPRNAIMYYARQALAIFGLIAAVGSIGLVLGYWWAKSGEKMFMQSVKADTSKIDCGSCRKGGAK